MPDGCQAVLASWAVGSPAVYHPQEAGFKIGRGSDMVQAVLQIHYDNYDNRDKAIDSSGITLFTTERLRQYDAGLLVVGAYLEAIRLPPGKLL
jgi:dopamine beta-monooxygenase